MLLSGEPVAKDALAGTKVGLGNWAEVAGLFLAVKTRASATQVI